MPGSPAAILFDLDGTLLDDDRAVSLALAAFHATHGAELGLPLEDLAKRWRHLLNLHFARYLAGEISLREQRRARVRDLFAAARPDLSADGADGIFAAYESRYRASWSACPDALPALSVLGAFRLAVLSNGDRAQQTGKLRRSGLADHFEAVFCSSETGCAKPAPEAFLDACHRLGIRPGDCVYVGDNLEGDARASAAAGMIGVWLDRGGSRADPGPGVLVIHSLGELPALLHTRMPGLVR